MGLTPRGKAWENAADAAIFSDHSHAAELVSRVSPLAHIRDLPSAEARIGALTQRYLHKGQFDYMQLPAELQSLAGKKSLQLAPNEATSLARYMKDNQDIIENLRSNPNNVTGDAPFTGPK